MSTDGANIALRIAVEQARWPIVVDPVVATLEAKLTASDGVKNDHFGSSLSVNGDTALVIGGRGFAYVFVRSGTTWSQEAELASGDAFDSATVSGNTVLLGATSATVGTNSAQGAAYVYVRRGTTWAQQAKLTANDGAANDYFGTVSVDGDTALVGAHGAKPNQGEGAAYIYTRTGTTWGQQAKLRAADGSSSGAQNASFGDSVSLSLDFAPSRPRSLPRRREETRGIA
jgi:hypothetical protein